MAPDRASVSATSQGFFPRVLATGQGCAIILLPKIEGDWLSGRALPSHGRGHWFKSSIAHLEGSRRGGLFHSSDIRARVGVLTKCR